MEEPRNQPGNEAVELPSPTDLMSVLVENRGAFLSFLERRIGHRESAEDVLQEAYARSLDRLPIEDGESAVAWFYRVLRNAVVDHYRRGGASDRALSALALRRIDVDGVSVQDYAAEAGITANNAGVRVFRARQALRKRVVKWCGACAERGCIDCTCGEPGSAGCRHGTASET